MFASTALDISMQWNHVLAKSFIWIRNKSGPKVDLLSYKSLVLTYDETFLYQTFDIAAKNFGTAPVGETNKKPTKIFHNPLHL